MALILLYTGKGKGKTSACVGQCLRAHGQGMAVAFGQFMKRDHQAGEQAALHNLLGTRFLAGGIGFFRDEDERPRHCEAAQATLAWARKQVGAVDMLVLDEACNALHYGFIDRQAVEELCQSCRTHNCHLVLSGRQAPDWLVDMADLVTRMDEVKHPFSQGVPAQRGIEF